MAIDSNLGLPEFDPGPLAPAAPFSEGVTSGVEGLKSSLFGAGAVVARGFGAKRLEESALAKAAEHSARAGEVARRVEDVTDVGSGFDYAKWAIGSVLPSSLAFLGSAALGRGFGAVMARNATVEATKAFAKTVGAGVGGMAASTTMEAGQIFPDAVESGVENPLLRTAIAAPAAAALDFAGNAIPAARLGLFGAKAATAGIVRRGLTGAVETAAKDVALNAPIEGLTEAGQSVIERLGAGKPTTGDEAMSDYINSFFPGMLGGTLTAPASAVRGYAGAGNQVPEQPPVADVSRGTSDANIAPGANIAPVQAAAPQQDVAAAQSAVPGSPATAVQPASAPAPEQLAQAAGAQPSKTTGFGSLAEAVAGKTALTQRVTALMQEAALPSKDRAKGRTKQAIAKEIKDVQKQMADVELASTILPPGDGSTAPIEQYAPYLNAVGERDALNKRLGEINTKLEAAKQLKPEFNAETPDEVKALHKEADVAQERVHALDRVLSLVKAPAALSDAPTIADVPNSADINTNLSRGALPKPEGKGATLAEVATPKLDAKIADTRTALEERRSQIEAAYAQRDQQVADQRAADEAKATAAATAENADMAVKLGNVAGSGVQEQPVAGAMQNALQKAGLTPGAAPVSSSASSEGPIERTFREQRAHEFDVWKSIKKGNYQKLPDADLLAASRRGPDSVQRKALIELGKRLEADKAFGEPNASQIRSDQTVGTEVRSEPKNGRTDSSGNVQQTPTTGSEANGAELRQSDEGIRSQKEKIRNDPFIKWLVQRGGIGAEYAKGLTGEGAFKANHIVNKLFKSQKRNSAGIISEGHGLDEIATAAADEGWISKAELDSVDGGVGAITERISAALRGEREPHLSTEDAEYTALKEKAHAGLSPEDLEKTGYEAIGKDQQERVDYLLARFKDLMGEAETETLVERIALRTEGQNEYFYRAELEDELEARFESARLEADNSGRSDTAVEDVAREAQPGAEGSVAPAGEATPQASADQKAGGVSEPLLESQTAADLAAKTARENDAAIAQRERIKREAEAGAGLFQLTGDVKPVSVADVEGAMKIGDLFAAPEMAANAQVAIDTVGLPAVEQAIVESQVVPKADQIDSPAFKKWFGDSKIVDANGKPLVVYHGTHADFTEFSTGKEMGAHFGTREQAVAMTSDNPESNGANVRPVYLSIKNPIRLIDQGQFDAETVASQLFDLGIMPHSFPNTDIEVQQFLLKKGYDGIVYLNRREGVGEENETLAENDPGLTDDEFKKHIPAAADSYIAFRPEQIKSAVGNNGSFDAANPDILFSRDAAVRPYDERGARYAAIGAEIQSYFDRVLGGSKDLQVGMFESAPGAPVGRFSPGAVKDIIQIAYNARVPLSVAAHEGWHRIEARHLNGQERAVIRRDLKKGSAMYNEVIRLAREHDAANNTDLADQIAGDPREASAYAFQFWSDGKMEAKGTIAKVFQKIKELLAKLKNFFDGYGFKSASDIFEAVDRGAYAKSDNSVLMQNARDSYTALDAASKDFVFSSRALSLYKERTAESVGVVSDEVADKALQTDATAKRILDKGIKVEDGQLVGVRLNINVMKKTGVPVMAIHKGNSGTGYQQNKGLWGGEVLSYQPVVTLKDAFMNVHQVSREKVASGESPKMPMASVDGNFVSGAEGNFNGVEFRFNPKREHLFVDAQGRVLRRADEVTIYKNSVYARGNIEYYGAEDVPARAGNAPTKGKLYADNTDDTTDLFSRDASVDASVSPTEQFRANALQKESLQDIARRVQAGELPHTQLMSALGAAVDAADAPAQTYSRLFGAGKEQFKGGLSRAYLSNFSTGNNIAKRSAGYKNVFDVISAYNQSKNKLIADNLDLGLSKWKPWEANAGDAKAAGKFLMDRTSSNWKKDAAEYQKAYANLTAAQKAMVEQANKVIPEMLAAEFDADKPGYRAALNDAQYAKWEADRKAQIDRLIEEGYVPERRYGNFGVVVHANVTDKNGVQKKELMRYDLFEHQAEQELWYRDMVGTETNPGPLAGLGLTIEKGTKYKPEYDAALSFKQFLDLADRHGVSLSQVEKEKLAKAMITADSSRRNRIFQRKNIPGYSEDATRVLSEFVTNVSNKVSYSEYGNAIQDALNGQRVTVGWDQAAGKPTMAIDPNAKVWGEDGENAGYFHGEAEKMVNAVVGPQETSNWSRVAKMAATMQFLGGSAALVPVQLSSIPINVVPYLFQHTSYTNALTTAFSSLSKTMANSGTLFDLGKLSDKTNKVDWVDNTPGMRDAMIRAGEDGTTMDTELYQLMGMTRGGLMAKSRTAQRAVEAWMFPFRWSEKANRVATFAAAYKVGSEKLSGDALYKFAQQAVFDTQIRYDAANRPAVMRNPIYALLLTFKTYPIAMTELLVNLYKEKPSAAVAMLGSLALMAGVNGMPFRENIMDLVDTIAQRLFGQPFNSQRWMRNHLKNASEAMLGGDYSGLFLNGLINSVTDLNMQSRVGLHNIIPGTRIAAADVDWTQEATQMLGPLGSQVIGTVKGAGSLLKGDFMEALREAGPAAAQNMVKAAEQYQHGYALDGKGQKLVDVSGWNVFWQAMGFSNATLSNAYDMDRIDKQTWAFYNTVRTDFIKNITDGVRDNDRDKVANTVELLSKWNTANPDMPIALDAGSLRRHIQQSGMPINQRTMQRLPQRLRGSSFSMQETVNP